MRHILYVGIGLIAFFGCADKTNSILEDSNAELKTMNENFVREVVELRKPIEDLSVKFEALVNNIEKLSNGFLTATDNANLAFAKMADFMAAVSPEVIASGIDDFHKFTETFETALASLNSLQGATQFLPVGMSMIGTLMSSAGLIPPEKADIFAEQLVSSMETMGQLSNMTTEHIEAEKLKIREAMAYDESQKPALAAFLDELNALNENLGAVSELGEVFKTFANNKNFDAIGQLATQLSGLGTKLTGLNNNLTSVETHLGKMVGKKNNYMQTLSSQITDHSKLISCFLLLADGYKPTLVFGSGKPLSSDCKTLAEKLSR